LLLSAGVGSACTRMLKIAPLERWLVPFAGVLITGLGILITYPYVFGGSLRLRLGLGWL